MPQFFACMRRKFLRLGNELLKNSKINNSKNLPYGLKGFMSYQKRYKDYRAYETLDRVLRKKSPSRTFAFDQRCSGPSPKKANCKPEKNQTYPKLVK